MKKLVLLFLLAAVGLTSAWAYDFSAVAPSGQTLYYRITSSTSPYRVSVTYPNYYFDMDIPTIYYKYHATPTGSLTIPSTVTYSGITYSVTSIRDHAFCGCDGLTSVTIPSSVTSIGSFAFWQCGNLTSFTIPNSVTSIGSSVFMDCYSLTSVNYLGTVAEWCGISFESILSSDASYTLSFNGTPVGTSLTIPNSVTTIGRGAFAHCSSLTSVTIPNSVTSIGDWAFYFCSGLTSVTIPNSVTSIGSSAFYGCSGLTSVTIPNSVTSIGYSTFYGCNGLTSVTIPNSVTSIGDWAFYFCSGLTSVTIPNSVTSIGYSTFYGCNGLTSVTIPNSVTSIGNNAFYHMRNIIYHGTASGSPWGALTVNGYEEGDLIYSDNTKTHLRGCRSTATSVTIPNSVTSIGDWAFEYCSGLTSVTIPNSVTSIGSSAFYGCSGLTSVTIPNSVTSIGYNAFQNVKVIIYGGTASGSPWGALRRYSSYYVEGDLIFEDSTKTIVIGCRPSATSVTIPNSVTSIGSYAFYNCTSLSHVTFNARNCSDLSPSSNRPFVGCTNISSVTIGDSVQRIPAYLFYSCSNLTDVTIGNSVTAIGQSAFSGCTGITEITSKVNVAPQAGTDAFNGVPINIPVYIPCGSAMSYYARWVQFTNFVEHFNFSVQAVSDDETMGSAAIQQMPTCDNSAAIVHATPADGYTFDHWSNGTTQNPYTLTVTSDTALTAHFTYCSPIRPQDLPYTEDFDSYTTSTTAKTGVEPTCWTLVHKDVDYTDEYKPMVYYASSNAHSGRYSLLLNKRGVYAMPQYEGDVNTLRLSMYLKQGNAAYQLIVGVMTDLDDVSTFVPVATIDNATTGHEFVTVDFNSYTGGGHYIAFRNTNASATNEWGCNYIDDLTLNLIPDEPDPSCSIQIADLPYTDNFDSYTTSTTAKTGIEPTCWTLVHQDVDMTDEYKPMIYYAAANAHSGDYSLILNKRGIYAMPKFEGDVRTLKLSMYLKQGVYKYQLQVGVMSNLEDVSTFVPITTIDNASTEMEHVTIDFSSYTGNGKYIAFHNIINPHTSGSFSCNYIDDLTLTLRPDECGIRIADLPYTENFDSYTESTTAKTGETPDCWTLAHEYVSITDEYRPMIYYGAASAHSGSYSLLLNKRGIYAMPKYEGEVSTLQMSLYARQSNAVYQLEVGVMSDLDDESTFVPVATLNNATTTEVTQYTVDFGGYTGTGKYIAFRNINGTSTNPAFSCNYIDDVTLYLAPEVVTYTITAVADDNTMGVVTGSGEYEAGTEATLTAVPYEGYRFVRWNDGDVSNPRIVTVTAAASYTAFFEESATANTAEITMVTVENHHNRIYWNAVDDAVSYKIYREDPMADQFILVGYTSATATNWTDPTANANAHSYKYKISYVNTDGIESPLSAAHKTMHLTISKGLDNHTWNLVWSPYEGREYKAYQIYRGTSEYDMACIDVVSSDGNITYTDENATSSTVYYQVAIVWGSSLSKGDDAIMSKSNIAHYASDYTIATRGNVITVKGCEHKVVRVFDMAGRLIDTKADAPSIVELRMDGTGAYLVQVGDSPAQKVVVIGR